MTRPRPTPQDVRQAYIEKKLKPTTGIFAVRLDKDNVFTPWEDRVCCGLSALIMGEKCPEAALGSKIPQNDGSFFQDFQVVAAASILLGIDADQFWKGFDDARTYATPRLAPHEDYMLGWDSYHAVKDLIK